MSNKSLVFIAPEEVHTNLELEALNAGVGVLCPAQSGVLPILLAFIEYEFAQEMSLPNYCFVVEGVLNSEQAAFVAQSIELRYNGRVRSFSEYQEFNSGTRLTIVVEPV